MPIPEPNAPSPTPAGQRRGLLESTLGAIERVGNALPHPASLFAILAALVVLVSAAAAALGLEVTHPATGEPVRPVSLLNLAGLHRMLTEAVRNYTGFAPLGTVLVAMLGMGVMESSGLIGTTLRLLVISAPPRLLTLVIVFAGVMSNTAAEIGYVLLVPLAGTIFLSAGRHPLAGVAAAFAGVSGGYSANLLLGTVDPLLAGLSEEAARLVDPGYRVNPAANYYFMAASTFVITAAGTWVTERVVAPRLGAYEGEVARDEVHPLTRDERRGLRYALVAAVLFALVLLAGTVPAHGFLRDSKTGDLLHSPFLSGIVTLIFLFGATTGVAYGVGARRYASDKDVVAGMGKAISTLGSYMVLVFFAAQFVAYFGWTNLGLIVAVEGAALLQASGLGGLALMLGFVVTTAFVNLFMGSASAKWAVMAPVFVPMFMLLGYTPELTQAAYRIGDSVTNVVSPMMSYFALIVAFVERYDRKAGMGTVIATMLPYSTVFLLCWSGLLLLWMALGLPVGPGAGLRLAPAS
jgi:aminobenzoyl-glutamate transport protein